MVVINYVFVVVLLVEGDGVLVAEGGAHAAELAGEAGEVQVAEEVGTDAEHHYGYHRYGYGYGRYGYGKRYGYGYYGSSSSKKS